MITSVKDQSRGDRMVLRTKSKPKAENIAVTTGPIQCDDINLYKYLTEEKVRI